MLYVIKNEYIIYSNIFTLFEGLKCLYTHTIQHTITPSTKKVVSSLITNPEHKNTTNHQLHQPPCSTTTVTTQTAMAHPRFDYSSPKRLRVDSPQSIGQSPFDVACHKKGAEFQLSISCLPKHAQQHAADWKGLEAKFRSLVESPTVSHALQYQFFQITDTSNVVRFNINPANFSWATRQKSSTIPWSVSTLIDGELQGSYTSKTLCSLCPKTAMVSTYGSSNRESCGHFMKYQ